MFIASTSVDSPGIEIQKLDCNAKFLGSKEEYEDRLVQLQQDLLLVQQAYHRQNLRAIIVFEGWDAAGKGGTIRRLTERMDPRGFRVHLIGPPTPEEQGRHYLFRFWQRIPRPGRIAIFDRSWYGRVLVERIEGFAKEQDWQRAYAEICDFERTLSHDGVRILKIFLNIDQKEQLKRFEKRFNNPYKSWKLTLEDFRNREKYPNYLKAVNDMFVKTSSPTCPWQIVHSNCKKLARMETLEYIRANLSVGINLELPKPSKEVVKVAKAAFRES